MIPLKASGQAVSRTPVGRIAAVLSLVVFLCLPLVFFGLFSFGAMQDISFAPAACLIPLVALGGVLVVQVGVRVFYRAIMGVRLSDMALHARTDRLGVGGRIQGELSGRAASQIDVTGITFELVAREWVRYRAGTQTRTQTHEEVLDTVELGGRSMQPGSYLQEPFELHLPPRGMHSFSYLNNKLSWWVRVKISMERWPDFVEEYAITVEPRLATDEDGEPEGDQQEGNGYGFQ